MDLCQQPQLSQRNVSFSSRSCDSPCAGHSIYLPSPMFSTPNSVEIMDSDGSDDCEMSSLNDEDMLGQCDHDIFTPMNQHKIVITQSSPELRRMHQDHKCYSQHLFNNQDNPYNPITNINVEDRMRPSQWSHPRQQPMSSVESVFTCSRSKLQMK
eukprot:gnl/Chilomastix_caulleri/1923.p1 GENE.gnl/Chilomastix_caulleri/1923~~gnl/Chilomastix_caulleri/1923.p1  ORF type:complete len:155 (+),score=32.58 gnl/Chilomastix_caulleri/1923:382-846(+)